MKFLIAVEFELLTSTQADSLTTLTDLPKNALKCYKLIYAKCFCVQIVCILYELLNILNISNQIFYQRQILGKLKVYLNMNLVFYYKKDIWKVYNAPPKESGFFPCDKYILSVP